MAVTKVEHVINPEVMGAMIDAKIEALAKFTPYAKVDTSLEGVPGDTKTVPSWNYVGDAEDFDVEAGNEMETTNLTASSTTFTIKCAGKSISIYETAINSGLGNPIGQAESQLAKAVAGKVDSDVVAAAYNSKVTVGDATTVLNYDSIVDCTTAFEDEEDGIEKVMFIHPKQEKVLLKDENFKSADKFDKSVIVKGSIGKIGSCWIKKSKKVKLNTEGTAYMCPIIKMEADSAETEYTEDELPAITIFIKKQSQLDHEWLPKKQKHDLTIAKYYGVALTNEAKAVVGLFAAAPTV